MKQIKVVKPCDECCISKVCKFRDDMMGNVCNTASQILTWEELIDAGLNIKVNCPYQITSDKILGPTKRGDIL